MVFMWMTSDHDGFTTGAISVLKHVDAAQRQPQRRVEVLAERPQLAPLVRPRVGDVGDVLARSPGASAATSGSPAGAVPRRSEPLAISGMIRVQNQWAPDGAAGSSVRRLIATRMRAWLRSVARGSCCRMLCLRQRAYVRTPSPRSRRGHPRLPDVLGQRVHDGLVQVLDDAVVRAVDVNGDLGHRPGLAAVESGDRDRAQAVVAGPGERVRRCSASGPTTRRRSARPRARAWDCSW